MKIEYLKEFITLARLNSFSRAAEELYISQSSLSKHIILLEQEFCVQLFNRSTRNIDISKAGQGILPYAIKLCEIHDQLETYINQHKQIEEHILTISSIPVMAQYNITDVITQFKAKYPYISITIYSQEVNEITKSLKSKHSELGFQRVYDTFEPDIEYLPYKTDLLVAVLNVSHPLSMLKSIRLHQISEEHLFFLDKSTRLYNLCYTSCVNSGFTPNITYTSNRPENLIEMVKNGMGVALLMNKHAKYFNQDGFVCIPIHPAIESTVFLTRIKDQKPSESALKFWKFVSENGAVALN